MRFVGACLCHQTVSADTESGADGTMEHKSGASAETAIFGVDSLPCSASSIQHVETDFDPVEMLVDSSSESESSDSDNGDSLRNSLAGWATQFNVPKNAVSALLKLLNQYHPNLPLDARTPHHTPRSQVNCSVPGGGQ